MPDAGNFRYMNFNFRILILREMFVGVSSYLSNKPPIIASKLSSLTGFAM